MVVVILLGRVSASYCVGSSFGFTGAVWCEGNSGPYAYRVMDHKAAELKTIRYIIKHRIAATIRRRGCEPLKVLLSGCFHSFGHLEVKHSTLRRPHLVSFGMLVGNGQATHNAKALATVNRCCQSGF